MDAGGREGGAGDSGEGSVDVNIDVSIILREVRRHMLSATID